MILSALNTMQKFIGIMDIVVIASFIIAILIGAFIGFFRITIKIANAICGFFFSLVFAEKFSRVLAIFIRKPIYKHFYKKVGRSSALSGIDDMGDPKEQFANVLKGYGLPKRIAKFIANHYSPKSAASIKDSICSSMASGITKVILVCVSFLFLWIGLSILFFFMKKYIENLRDYVGFRIFDGVMGTLLMILVCFVVLEIVFWVCTFFKGDTYGFFMRDMRLLSHKGMGLGRWFYNKNLVKAFMDMFF